MNESTTPSSLEKRPPPGRTMHWIFLALASLTTVAAPWMLGSTSVLAQEILLLGAVCTFIAGLILRKSQKITPGARAAWKTLRWSALLGAVFLALMLVQALYSSHRVVITGNLWTLVPVFSDGSWPSSLDAPFDFLPGDWLPYKNAWRYLLIFSTGWIYAIGLSLGLIDRGDVHRFLRVLGLNAAALAIVCIVHRLSGSQLTLWAFAETFDFTRSPVFFYKNHNGAYLAASLALTFALAANEPDRRWKIGWHASALALLVTIISVNSRAAIGCALLWTAIYLGTIWRKKRTAGRSPFSLQAMVGGVVLAGIICALIVATGGKTSLARLAPAVTSPIEFLDGGPYRSYVRKLGMTLWGDHPWFGWGGGAYLYLFNENEQRVPEIAQIMYREQPTLNRLVGPTVNCDWIEFGIEYGVIGVGLLVMAVALPVIVCLKQEAHKNTVSLFLLLGVSGVAIHCWFDYILRNPAILILFLALLVAVTRLVAKPPVARSRRRHGGRGVRPPATVSTSP